jgi:hypothetical protein
MPASTYADLYDWETLIENGIASAISTILGASSIGAQVNVTRGTGTEETPRVDVTFSPGSSLGHMTTIGQANPKQVPDMFDGTLTLRISTARPIEDDDAELHGEIRGWVRYVMSAGARGLNETILPYLQIMDMLPSGSASQIYDEKSQDITELSYAVKFAIRPSAWPTGEPEGSAWSSAFSAAFG